MRLLTNSNNINSLKMLTAAELANTPLQVVGVAPNDARLGLRNILPILEVDGSRIFTPAPATILLLQRAGLLSDQDLQQCEQLVDWETSQLYPVCQALLQSAAVNKSPDTGLKTQLFTLLSTIERSVASDGYVLGHKLSVVDILVWCDVYPAATDKLIRKELEAKLPVIVQWFDKLYATPTFSKSSQKFGRGLDGCKSSASLLVSFNNRGASTKPAVPTNTQPLAASSSAGNDANRSKGSAATPTAVVTEKELSDARAGWTRDNTTKHIESSSPPPAAVILPVTDGSRKNVMITSALPYVNNVPHLGNIVGCVLSADVFARYARLRGHNTLFVCGTDEYGTSTETKAMEEGLTPRQICDKYNRLHGQIYEWFDISFDKFGRTTTEQQTQIAQEIFWDLHKAGMTSEDCVDQLHCENCDRFLADRFVEGVCPLCSYEDARGDQCDACGKLINAVDLKQPRCKVCAKCPTVKTSKHIFLDLPQVEAELKEWLDRSSEKWTNNARVIAKSWLKGGLQPRCITRDLKWGTPVPLPGYENKVFYVWFDAPIGYISITAQYTEHWKQWWQNPDNVEYWQFMAKDNVPFHSVVFPSSLLGTKNKWTMVNRLMSTEYLNYEDAKFSKSRGIGVFGSDAIETGITADVWRFYLMYTRPENQDSTFKWEDLMLKNNSELLANLGNFVNRATKFTKDNFSYQVPNMSLTAEDWEMVCLVNREIEHYQLLLDDAREREAITTVFNISRLGNQLMQHNTPWKLVKGSDADKARAGTVVGISINMSCLLSILIEPYMPGLSRELQRQLDAPVGKLTAIPDKFCILLPAGHRIGEPSPLVAEIKQAQIEKLKARFAGKQSKSEPNSAVKNAATATTSSNVAPSSVASSSTVEELEARVAEQGNLVRKIKADKASKEVINAAVAILLDLKKQLSTAQGLDPNAAANAGKKKKK